MIALSFTLVLVPRVVKKTFAVETYYVGVYWDAKGTSEVKSIYWGELAPGSVGTVSVYIQNEELAPSCYLVLSSESWEPTAAAGFLSLSWNYDYKEITLGKKIPVTLTLKVARNIVGISDFSFNIIISGTEYIIADLDHDGDVDIYDLVIVAAAYNSTPSAPNWNPAADLNSDGLIDIYDVIILAGHYIGTY